MIWFDLTTFCAWFDLNLWNHYRSIFPIQNVVLGRTNGTDGKTSLRAFDRCHICLWNLNFDMIMAWFWVHSKLWFENGIKSWFDLIWRRCFAQNHDLIWFGTSQKSAWFDLIWYQIVFVLIWFDLIWICPPLTYTYGCPMVCMWHVGTSGTQH